MKAKELTRIEDVAVFEDKTKKLILELCGEYLDENSKNIRDEFKKVSINDMDKLSYATSTGKLSKGAKDVLDGRISECLNKQMKYDLRVSNLANLCYQNGLESPLTEQHIQGIVFIDDDNIYADKIAALINDEIERFTRIKESERLKAEREAKVNAEKEAREKLLSEKRGLENKFRPVIEGSDLSAIGHTRMATESAITTNGSHPYSTGEDECLVHNGSLSNHNNLRRKLKKNGSKFNSENDTEVAAGYISDSLKNRNLKQTLKKGLSELDGFYTFIAGTHSGFAVLRDEIACKPAVIAETKDYVAICSEFQAMAHMPNVNNAKIFEPEPGIVYSWGK